MEIELVVSIVAICGFAIALTYNVYEFRKVGRHLDALTGEHTKMMEHLDRMTDQLTERMRKDHQAIVTALKGLWVTRGSGKKPAKLKKW